MKQLPECFVFALLAYFIFVTAASADSLLRLAEVNQLPYERKQAAYFAGEDAFSGNQALQRKLAATDTTKNKKRVAILMFGQSARSEHGKTCSPISISKQKLFARNIAHVFSRIQASLCSLCS